MTALLAWLNDGALWLLVWSWQALVLLACVWAGLKIARVQAPALRHQLWLCGLLAVAVLPLATVLAQRWPTPRPAHQAFHYAAELPRLVITSNLQARESASPTQVKPPAPSFPWRPALLLVWLGGVLLAAVRIGKSCARLHRACLHARATTLRELDCAELAATLPRVDIRLSEEISSPVLCGVRRPLILLPADIVEWTTAAERRAMLQHELAHLARRDHYVNLLTNTLNAVFFFHPLVRYACRQLCLERELACDDRVIGAGVDAAIYAESLLKAAERSLPKAVGFSLPQPAFFTSKQVLERRIKMIMNPDRVRVLTQQWRYLILSVALLAVAAWLLIPGRLAQISLAQTQSNNAAITPQFVQALAADKAFSALTELAVNNDNQSVRQQAVELLLQSEGDGSTAALLVLYEQSKDNAVRARIIRRFGERNEVDALALIRLAGDTKELVGVTAQQFELIAQQTNNAETRRIAQERLKIVQSWQASTKDSGAQAKLPPPPPPPPPSDYQLEVQALQALLREIADAKIRRDMAFLERVYADDFEAVGPHGEVLNKAQALAAAKAENQAIKKIELDDFRFKGEGNSLVANFLITAYFDANGKENTLQVRSTVSFLKRQGSWQIVGAHSSLVQ